ncbi:carboxypeptidase regulatory-like domain-containing protein [Winogradskyella sp. PG-2]|uniref:carboxypeptidase regulatory-like domain-containing protein n=1 Tax=Winogradskyella sp. PG-2 TaxID=754409 RepID=UPI0004586F7A|nr:carboxypeptidase regulatory-like domain-containing protein [Winogradskyella sp. PG-2]BAO75386.1 thiamin-regulated outer membrane receptor Omr1 [Winogradskyella sp. PG-2]
MKKSFLLFLFGIAFSLTSFAQQTTVKGSVLDGTTGEPIPDVTITIEETGQTLKTDAKGEFSFSQNVPLGEQVLKVEKVGFVTKRYPIIVNEGKTVDISGMTLDYDQSDKKDLFIISISDDNLNSEDDGLTDNISGLLQASRDVFLSAAAYDFSATFFRPRGLDNANGKVLINGIEMNKQFSGRPQWANWGGLNDVQRNQEFSMGMSANDYNFGDLAGTNNIVMRASKYRRGGRVSYASANRSYTNRVMASYSSGLLEGGWSYSVLGSRRFGDEGYVDGTLYDANSFFVAVEKQLNEKHSLNFTGIYAQNRRGRSTAITQEVFDLKGRKYNPFWGKIDGEQRNSRMRETNEPILMLNHFWDISSKVKLNTNVAYQFGEIANSRIDNGGTRLVTIGGESIYLGGARNPTPEYYQNLPSYHLQDANPTAYDYQLAFTAQEAFVNDGQLNWNNLYEANASLNAQGGNSLYAVQSDVIKDQQLSINSIIDVELADNIKFNGALNYRSLKSENFARIEDLLGGSGYLDVDFFAEETPNTVGGDLEDVAQSDLQNPNRIVGEGDRYKYNFEMNADVISAFAQAQFKYNKVDFYVGANVSQTSYQRNGIYENGNFQGGGNNGSLGKSDKLDFSNYGLKGGFTYKVTGKHLIDVNASYFTKAPTLRNSFSNSRQTNATVIGIESEKVQSLDVSYIFRSPIVKARLTGFYSGFKNGTDIGFYFTEDLAGLGVDEGDAFVQEILTNVERRNIGVEFGIEAQVTPTIKLKGAASVGQYTFQNNPNLYLTSADIDGALTFGDGTTQIKDYHVASGPERAFQVGFEYRDPDYWNIGVTSNFFSNAYLDMSNLARSANFTSDYDGNTFNDYDPIVAKELLKQEQFDDYMLVNVIGGKSWKIDDYFVGFFATINNIFNEDYRTGGFEQSRLANFRRLQEDKSRDNGPVFGPRYFFGNGTTYYLNVYVRF